MFDEKYVLRHRTQTYLFFRTLHNGVRTLFSTLQSSIMAFALCFVMLTPSLLYLWAAVHYKQLIYWSRFVSTLLIGFVIITGFIGFAGWIPGAKRVYDNLVRIGMVNYAGEAPFPIHHTKSERMCTLTFFVKGIPLSEWEQWKDKIESALNITVLNFTEGHNKREINLRYVPGIHPMPSLVQWDASYLDPKDFTIVLGEYPAGKAVMDFAKIPHWLCGATTGGGKSVLLSLIALQCLEKGAEDIQQC